MVDLIIVSILLVVLGAVCFYLICAKRRGVKCVGCPHASSCGGKCGEKKKDDTSV